MRAIDILFTTLVAATFVSGVSSTLLTVHIVKNTPNSKLTEGYTALSLTILIAISVTTQLACAIALLVCI